MRNFLKLLSAAASALALAACGGGAGGSTGGGTFTPPPPAPVNFDTEEYRFSVGLDEINAIAAYERGLSGDGVTVAIIDTGTQPDHPDLDANLDPRSRDVAVGRTTDTGPVGQNGHGTWVAGIIAAEKNDIGGHGVAFEANLLSLRADEPGACGATGSCSLLDSDIARGIDIAIAEGARIINLSLGGGSPSLSLRQAMENAAAAGALIVISAGNTGGASPSQFAQYVTSPNIVGQGIIVGAVDRDQELYSTSARAGVEADYYIAAPSGVTSTGLDDTFVTLGGGTSFAAPHVSGAAALLMELFPNLTAEEIVEILLDTATDLGAAGTDDIFGRGFLNLDAATAPQGATTTSVAGENGAAVAVDIASGGVIAPAAVGDALTTSAALAAVPFTDGYDRAYAGDLTARIAAPNNRAVGGRLAARNDDIAYGQFALGQWVAGGAALRTPVFNGFSANPYEQESALTPEVPSFSASVQLSKTAALDFNSTETMRPQWGGGQTPFLFSSAGEAHVANTGAGRVQSLALVQSLANGMDVAVRLGAKAYDLEAADKAGVALTEAPTATLASVSLTRPMSAARFGLETGVMRERGALLGGLSDGVLGLAETADTTYGVLDVAADGPLSLAFRASATGAHTRTTAARNSLFSDIDALLSFGFSAEVSRAGLFRRGDRAGLALAQPLRVEAGHIRTLWLASEDEGFEENRISLAPSGREMSIEAVYKIPTAFGVTAGAHLIGRRHPGHNRNATAEAAAVFTLERGF